MNRPENPDLTRAEWINLITAVVLEIGEENAKGILRRAIGEERANLLIEKQEGPRLSKDDNRAIVKELYTYIPGETREEKTAWSIRLGKQVFGDAERFSEILNYVEHRVTEHEEAGGTIDKMPPKPAPAPNPPKEQINRGGDGLYKPSSNLWLLPQRHPTNGSWFRGKHLGKAGEFRDREGTQLVKWFRWPDKIGPMKNKPINGKAIITYHHADIYHNNRIKIRGAKAKHSGSWFLAWDMHGQRVFEKRIIDRNVRQE